MEFPIKVIMVLFVSIIVGITIINFATDAFDDSKQKLKEFNEEDEKIKNEHILEVNSIGSKQIAGLAKECFENNEFELENAICYAVIGEIDATEDEILENFELNESYLSVNLNDSINAIKIKYNAIEKKVEISG